MKALVTKPPMGTPEWERLSPDEKREAIFRARLYEEGYTDEEIDDWDRCW